jgi:geranylgeranyl reductase
MRSETVDVLVVGGGPAGATAARNLADTGRSVMLLDREGKPKPCGGAVPPRCIEDFEIVDAQLKARIGSARIIAPSARSVDMVISQSSGAGPAFVGMVDRDAFDPWLRDRAEAAGALRRSGTYLGHRTRADGDHVVTYQDKHDRRDRHVEAKIVIGADGANSAVRRQAFDSRAKPPFVFAYHEIVVSPEPGPLFDPSRCDVIYDGAVSPDFYGWVFPHGQHTSVGVGSARKGFDLKRATALLRERHGLTKASLVRAEGAPLPLKPLKRWHRDEGIILAGDAAGVVAPSSGEGIYYAMLCGQLVADAVERALDSGKAGDLASARQRFMRDHRMTFLALGLLQYVWYASDSRRERFVGMCADRDVQRLTWESYLNKRLVRRDPMAHARVFMKDLGQLSGLLSPWRRSGRRADA